MSDTPQLLLNHHLKTLRLPTFLREYDKLARQCASEGVDHVRYLQRLMADHGIACSMSRSGNVWDNAAMESFFSSLKTERIGGRVYRTSDEARADVFDYIERFYNPTRRHSTIGYVSPVDFEKQAMQT